MPRASRHYVPQHVWHITHRCHRRQFLLKFVRDRLVLRQWLYTACRRHGLCVLDYATTSNHIHLLVRDRGHGEIARSLQLVAGRTAQGYNERKGRHGAFWEDRYHATAVETGEHLARCLVYIDLNMVRAGAVAHPREWKGAGYQEIQQEPERCRVVNRAALAEALEIESVGSLAAIHSEWIETALRTGAQARMPEWSESVAVGGRAFVEGVAASLGVRAKSRQIETCGEFSVLRETPASYSRRFGAGIARLTR